MHRKSSKDHSIGGLLSRLVIGTDTPTVLRQAQSKMFQRDKFLVVTPNPEMIILALANSDYADMLVNSDIAIPDGIGLLAGHRFIHFKAPRSLWLRFPVLMVYGIYVGISTLFSKGKSKEGIQIIRGRDIFVDFIKLANKKNYRVFLYGARGNSVQKAQEALLANYKNIKLEVSSAVEYTAKGVPINELEQEKERAVLEKINSFKSHMLFIGISPPKELLFLKRNWDRLDFRMAMHVGQTFDVLAGTYKKAPKIFEQFGLEWFWRFLSGTKSLKRIWLSFPLFPWKVFWWKMGRD